MSKKLQCVERLLLEAFCRRNENLMSKNNTHQLVERVFLKSGEECMGFYKKLRANIDTNGRILEISFSIRLFAQLMWSLPIHLAFTAGGIARTHDEIQLNKCRQRTHRVRSYWRYREHYCHKPVARGILMSKNSKQQRLAGASKIFLLGASPRRTNRCSIFII